MASRTTIVEKPSQRAPAASVVVALALPKDHLAKALQALSEAQVPFRIDGRGVRLLETAA